MSDALRLLQQIIDERKLVGDTDSSYVASLHNKGLNKILEKVGEECTETIIAAKDAQLSGDTRAVIDETADLWFHCMIMLSSLGESADAVIAELERRFGVSGITEKLSRE